MKIGDLVRFNHQKDGGPVHRVASVMSDGMIELHDMGGYFGPDLFVTADDIGGIPLDGRVPASKGRRITAGPYTLEIPPNGVAILYEADEGGTDRQLPGGVGYLDAFVQFAGEILRLQAMVSQMQKDRADGDTAIRDAIRRAVEANRLLAAVRKVRDGYADQARFADHEPATYFREFVRRLDTACEVSK